MLTSPDHALMLPPTAFGNLPIDSVQAYIAQVNRIDMISAEEEISLAERYRTASDLEAARKLVMSNLRFVVKVAYGYTGYGLAVGDLIQEGNIGLMKAVKHFDPTVGVRLISFAVHWIKSEIHDFIIRNWRIVKVATTKAQRKLFFNLRKFKTRLGWFSTEEVQSVAKALNVSSAEVLKMEERLNAMDEALEPRQAENDLESFSPIDFLADDTQNPERCLAVEDAAQQSTMQLQTALDTLDARSRDILARRWLAEKKTTLQVLAAEYSVSVERIRQLEKAAMRKLKAVMVG